MATGNAGTGEETGPGAESNEHDYAHTEDGAVIPHAASVGPQAASVGPQAASVGPQAASVTPHAASSSPHAASVGPQAASVGPHAASVGPQAASVGPQATSVGLQAASVGPQAASVTPHAASSSPHAASVGPQAASVGLQAASVGPQAASVTPHAASVGLQAASVGPQAASVTPHAASSSPHPASVGPQAASVGPQAASSSSHAASSSPHAASYSPHAASVGPQAASVSPQAASSSPHAASSSPHAASSSGAPVTAAPGPAVGAEVDCPGPRRPRRSEDTHCSCCRLLFQRHGRSFNRRAVYTFTSPETVRWVFPGCAVTDKSFLCETCAQVVRTRGKRKQSGKRSLWLKPPAPKKVKERPASGRRMGKKSKAALLVSKSSYKAAFQMLWSAKGARKPMMEFFSKQLKMEMKALSRRPDSPFQLKVSGRRPLASFPWRRCLSWAQDHAPLTTSCLRAMFPELKSSRQLTEEQAVMLLERRTVVALAIPLFTRNIWRNNFLQAALGAELRLQGCSGAALDALNAMGLCQNKDTVRLLLQRLRNGGPANRDSGMMHKLLDEEMGEEMSDEEEEEEEDDEEEDEEDEDEDEEDEEDEEEGAEEEVVLEDEEHGEEEMMMAIEEEVEEEEIQEQVQEEEEEEPAANEKEAKKRRSKKARRLGKRKERGGEEEEEGQRKRKVVVVRLGLLKGHSEVGRSDLSAP